MKEIGVNLREVEFYVVQTADEELVVKEADEILASDKTLRGPWRGLYGTGEAREAFLEASYVIPHIDIVKAAQFACSPEGRKKDSGAMRELKMAVAAYNEELVFLPCSCPECGKHKWIRVTDARPEVRPGPSGEPLVFLQCNNCGYMA